MKHNTCRSLNYYVGGDKLMRKQINNSENKINMSVYILRQIDIFFLYGWQLISCMTLAVHAHANPFILLPYVS